MILYIIVLLGILVFLSRGQSILSYFISLEILFFIYVFYTGVNSYHIIFVWVIILIVGLSILILTILISSMRFFGRDSQRVFLD